MDINEIARRAGVSRATVSRYLNDGYVSREKRELIGRVIAETGYVPSRQAQQLRTGKTRLVGVIIPKINSQSVSRMVEGLTDRLAESGYQVVIANTNNNPRREIDYLGVLADRTRVEGIILIATELSEDHKAAIGRLQIPLVVLGQRFEGHPCVFQDDYHAMRDVCRLALSKATSPAYLGVADNDASAGRERRRGFLDACAEAGLQVPDEALLTVDFSADSGYFGAERIIRSLPATDTIICASDNIAFGAMICIHEYGRRVPDEVQVTGMGDSPSSRIGRPSLTTVHLPYKTAGIEAARLLLSKLTAEGDGFPTELKMGYELYGRSSIR